MVVIKYKKMGLGAFIGEEEMLDCWRRVSNRAELVFNEGFKVLLYYPAAIGHESEKEYLIINTPLDDVRTKGKIEELFPEWIEIIDAYECSSIEELLAQETRDILLVEIPRFKDNKERITNEFLECKNAGKIIDFKIEDDRVKVAVSSNLSNAMCDIISEILAKNNLPLDYNITRTKLMIEDDERLVEVDKFLEEKAKEN